MDKFIERIISKDFAFLLGVYLNFSHYAIMSPPAELGCLVYRLLLYQYQPFRFLMPRLRNFANRVSQSEKHYLIHFASQHSPCKIHVNIFRRANRDSDNCVNYGILKKCWFILPESTSLMNFITPSI